MVETCNECEKQFDDMENSLCLFDHDMCVECWKSFEEMMKGEQLPYDETILIESL